MRLAARSAGFVGALVASAVMVGCGSQATPQERLIRDASASPQFADAASVDATFIDRWIARPETCDWPTGAITESPSA